MRDSWILEATFGMVRTNRKSEYFEIYNFRANMFISSFYILTL